MKELLAKSIRFANRQSLRVQKRFMHPKQLPLEYLMTDNRKDIEYRIQFLNAVLNEGCEFDSTKYYYFISDPKRWTTEPAKEQCEYFIELMEDIKKNGIQKPLTAIRVTDDTFRAKTIIDGKKEWNRYENVTGYQLMEGAHRLATARYLEYDDIPVRVLYNPLFEIPDYTKYIKTREDVY